MTGPPELRDLLGDDLPAEDRARLQRVHELLVAAGPPPELPPSLAEAPDRASRSPSWLPRRRLGAALALAAAIATLAFLGGYLAGYERTGFDESRTAVLTEGTMQAVVSFGNVDADGNTPMRVKVEGFRALPHGDYYTLYMTRGGRPIATCGTFNVDDAQPTTLRFSIAYDPANFDGLMISRWQRPDRKHVPLLRTKL